MKPWEKDETFLSRWLNNELSDEELHAFESEEESKDFKDIILAAKSLKTPDYQTQNAFHQLKLKIDKKPQVKQFRISRFVKLGIAASLILAFTFAIYWFTKDTIIKTGEGQRQLVVLPGGSEVILNANSSIRFDEDDWEKARTLHLSGEAHFKVTGGNLFSVHTANNVIKVIGTVFNIKSRMGQLQVSCFSGKINISHNNDEIILERGEGVNIRSGQIDKVKLTSDLPDWLSGKSSFNNAPLAVVVEKLEIVYGINVVNKSLLPKQNFTGSFPHSDIHVALKLIFSPFNVSYELDPQSMEVIVQP